MAAAPDAGGSGSPTQEPPATADTPPSGSRLRAQASESAPPAAAPSAARALRAQASAPGKVILFGEHAVVYGEPAVSLALTLRTRVGVHVVGEGVRVDGHIASERHHSYILAAVRRVWPDAPGLRIFSESQVPSASGTGSSAALATATVAACASIRGRFSRPFVAQHAFDAEFDVQGGASPNDTSCSTAGGGVVLSRREVPGLGEPLWRIHRRVGEEDRSWNVYAWRPRELPLVVGVTSVRGSTREQVAKVRGFVTKSGFGADTVRDVGRVALKGLAALDAGDLAEVGRLMEANQRLLHTMGVNHPATQRLLAAVHAAPGTLGAKITGAGGGGSIVVLTDSIDEAARAIEAAGGRALRVTGSSLGVEVEPETLDEGRAGEDAADDAASARGLGAGEPASEAERP